MLDVDASHNIVETNEANNYLTGPQITVVNPDMQPGNLRVATVTNLGGSTFTVTYNTTNNGPGIMDGTAAWTDQLFFSTIPCSISMPSALMPL